ncbi:sodium-dependent glucose transporter 1A-like [Mercenaria mercenaria]|uniref:sodium-dependent glucose transporter 1A-like n=1 Tax=Mercenaria mercenaria TaxID=6596 RepID=UPI00234E8831|nr:sodium-dependent glucose transporter 1A-like [Mercenaria mercenaria]
MATGHSADDVSSRIMHDLDSGPEFEISDNSADSDASIKIERQRSVSLDGAVTRKKNSVKLSGSSKKTRTTPFSDPVFRIKLLKTGFLLWNMTILGWEYRLLGPIFPDLQDIAGVSLKQGSWFFTGNAIGYLAGCLLAGLTQKRFSTNLMLFFYTMVSARAFPLLPWIPSFEVIVFLFALTGLGYGKNIRDVHTCSVHGIIFEIWDDKVGPYFQMMHVVQALGGILSPLATKPFLRKEQDEHLDKINSTETICLQNARPSSITTVSTNNSNNPDDVMMTDTDLHYALFISGLLLVSAAVPFLAIFFKNQHSKKSQRQKYAKNVSSVDEQKLLPTHIERTVLCIFILNSFVATAFLDLFPTFLTTFVIERASMTQQNGANLSSAYFAMYGVGNFLNIFASIYIKTTKIIIFSYITTGIMLTCVIFSVLFPNKDTLSVFIPLCGASEAIILPTIFTWIQEHVTPVTGKLASGLLISGSLGVTLNPLLVGYLMEVHSPMWFLYLSLVYTIFCAVLFVMAVILTETYSNKRKLTEESGIADKSN